MITEPTMTCSLCGSQVTVVPYGQGYPPDVARRKLRKICAAKRCEGEPVYAAGVDFRVLTTGQEGDVRVAAPPAPAEPERDELGGGEG